SCPVTTRRIFMFLSSLVGNRIVARAETNGACLEFRLRSALRVDSSQPPNLATLDDCSNVAASIRGSRHGGWGAFIRRAAQEIYSVSTKYLPRSPCTGGA